MSFLQAELAELRIEYVKDAWARMDALDLLLERLAQRPDDREALDQVRRRFHGFAGSGLSHGFPRVSQLGRQAEQACLGWLEGGVAVPEEGRRGLQETAGLIANELGPRTAVLELPLPEALRPTPAPQAAGDDSDDVLVAGPLSAHVA